MTQQSFIARLHNRSSRKARNTKKEKIHLAKHCQTSKFPRFISKVNTVLGTASTMARPHTCARSKKYSLYTWNKHSSTSITTSLSRQQIQSLNFFLLKKTYIPYHSIQPLINVVHITKHHPKNPSKHKNKHSHIHRSTINSSPSNKHVCTHTHSLTLTLKNSRFHL